MTAIEKAQLFQHDDIVKLIVMHESLLVKHEQLQKDFIALQKQNASLQRQVEWYQKQLFGPKSEKRYLDGDRLQIALNFGETASPLPEPTKPTATVERTDRRSKQRSNDLLTEEGLRFSAEVPVKEIRITPKEIEGLTPDQYTVIREETVHRLAQRPGSAVVLRYVTPVIKLKQTQAIVQASAPVNVLERCSADVSVLAGLLIDKFVYHLPLYRQHQRLLDQGFELSRATLTNWVKRAIALLTPIYESLFKSVLNSTVLAMDDERRDARR